MTAHTPEAMELLPCPFCGQAVTMVDNTDFHHHPPCPDWLVGCDRCNETAKRSVYISGDTPLEALAAWNTRDATALAERDAKIVAWLRKSGFDYAGAYADGVADAIERGEHLK